MYTNCLRKCLPRILSSPLWHANQYFPTLQMKILAVLKTRIIMLIGIYQNWKIVYGQIFLSVNKIFWYEWERVYSSCRKRWPIWGRGDPFEEEARKIRNEDNISPEAPFTLRDRRGRRFGEWDNYLWTWKRCGSPE